MLTTLEDAKVKDYSNRIIVALATWQECFISQVGTYIIYTCSLCGQQILNKHSYANLRPTRSVTIVLPRKYLQGMWHPRTLPSKVRTSGGAARIKAARTGCKRTGILRPVLHPPTYPKTEYCFFVVYYVRKFCFYRVGQYMK